MVILDNFGLLLAGFFRAPSTAVLTVGGIKDTSGVSFSLRPYDTIDSDRRFNKIGADRKAQVGKGTTPVTRQDFVIESPFTNGGVEDNPQNSNASGYVSGLGKIEAGTLIASTTGAGTITEVVKQIVLEDSFSTIRTMIIMRDIISPASFIASESINVNHEVLI